MEHYEEKILKNGKKKMVRAKGHLEQKLIITFSRKMMEYQRSIRKRTDPREPKAIRKIWIPKNTRKVQTNVTRFIKKEGTNKRQSTNWMRIGSAKKKV